MKYQTVVSDIDATLMPQDNGTKLKSEVAQAIIELEQSGVMMILASARAYQGVAPIAKQLKMDEFGGYIITENGASIYDAKTNELMFAHEMAKTDVLKLWKLCQEYEIDFAFSQKEQMIASDFSKGFFLDHCNCDIDYVVTNHPKRFMIDPIMKCSLSKNERKIKEIYPLIKQSVEQAYPYKVYYSTANIIDILAKECGKEAALQQLADSNLMSWNTTAAIGDSYSDIAMIQKAALGATLENGKNECKEVCDLIVESCENDGCISFFQTIMKENKSVDKA